MDVSEEELQGLYSWVDEIPLSRPKRNIARDFADGVLLAELVAHYFPKMVELHNYSAANGMQQKLYNWNTLNLKVLKKLGAQLSKAHMQDVANCVPLAVERALKLAKVKIAAYQDDGPPSGGRATPSGSFIPAGALQADLYAAQAGPGSGCRAGRAHAPPQQLLPASEVLAEKERTISELRETNEILETKVRKLEQLVKLKDAKIQTLMQRLQAGGLA